MPWYIYALIASVLFAIIPLQKRKFNDNAKDLAFWSSFFSFVLTLAMFPVLEFPELEAFYIVAILTGISGVAGGILQFKLSAKRMGRTLPVQIPLQVFACFVIYCFFVPEYYQGLVEKPLFTAAIVMSIIALTLASQFIRKSDNTMLGFVTVVPVGLVFSAILVYYKILMDAIPGNVSNIILAYIMVHYFTVSICFIIQNMMNKHSVVLSEKLASGSLLIAVLSVFAYYFLFNAVYLASNPAFPIAFYLLIPVWIKIYMTYFLKRRDDASLKMAIIIMLATCLLMIAG